MVGNPSPVAADLWTGGRGCESRESQLYDCQRGFEARVKTLGKGENVVVCEGLG